MKIFKRFFLIIPILALAFASCSKSSQQEKDIDSGSIIIGHVTDSHSWHMADYVGKDGKEHVIGINLPVILWDEGHLVCFSSKQFHHGHEVYQGKHHTYALVGGGMEKEEIVCVEPASEGADVLLTSHDGTSYAAITNGDGKALKPLDFSITKTAAAIMIAVILLIVIVLASAKKYRVRNVPKGMQSLIEILVLHVKDDIVEPILGHHTQRFLPYLLTLFFFIIFCNILGLIPFFPAGANITGNIAVTAILALITFLITNLNGTKHYWKDIFNTPGVPWWLKAFPLMPIVELVGVFTKPIVLMIRLFANMTAGHIVILGFILRVYQRAGVPGGLHPGFRFHDALRPLHQHGRGDPRGGLIAQLQQIGHMAPGCHKAIAININN